MRFLVAVISALTVFLATTSAQYVLQDDYPALAIREALADTNEYNNVDIFDALLAREAGLEIAESAYLKRRADRKNMPPPPPPPLKHCANTDCDLYSRSYRTVRQNCETCHKPLSRG